MTTPPQHRTNLDRHSKNVFTVANFYIFQNISKLSALPFFNGSVPVCTPSGIPNAERQAFPVIPLSYSEHHFLYLAPVTCGRVYCPCFPAKSLPDLSLVSVGWRLDSLQLQFGLFFLFLKTLSPFGTGTVVPTGIVETPVGTGAGLARTVNLPAGLCQLASR